MNGTYHDTVKSKGVASSPEDGAAIRRRCRDGSHSQPTAGCAASYIQANLVVLPARYAHDFRNLCARNPVTCPLLAESSRPGSFDSFKSHIPGVTDCQLFVDKNIDIRTDVPKYSIYQNGELIESDVRDVSEQWNKSDSVAFLIGCSFSFEAALAEAGLVPNHVRFRRNVPIYRTNVPLCAAGVFEGANNVVSMRLYPERDIDNVRRITRAFGICHGEPIAWGWEAVEKLGIRDIRFVDWGDEPVDMNGRELGDLNRDTTTTEVPVFWGCGVTPQEAVMKAGDRIEGVVIGHTPGHMLVLDIKDGDIRTNLLE